MMGGRSGSSIAAACKAASISSPKASASHSTKRLRRKDRAQATSARSPDSFVRGALPFKLTIVLFDIDGTLVRTGGAGVRAMARAFEDLFGVARAFDGIPMAGRTDKSILEDAAARARLEIGPQFVTHFRTRYCERLVEALPEPGHVSNILPGVRSLLETLVRRPDVFLALLTGNCEEGAKLKL